MEEYGYIYKTTCLANGKIYIGQCCRKDSNHKNYLGSGYMIEKAIKKYGRKTFTKEILKICCNQQQLNNWERVYIAKYNSTDVEIGYNISKGGAISSTYKDLPQEKRAEIKTKLSKNHFSRKLSTEQKKDLFNDLNRLGIGLVYEQDKEQFMKNSHAGGAKRKQVLQKTIYTEIFGQKVSFCSSVDAEKELKKLGFDKVDNRNITSCCRGERQSSGGLKFSYEKD